MWFSLVTVLLSATIHIITVVKTEHFDHCDDWIVLDKSIVTTLNHIRLLEGIVHASQVSTDQTFQRQISTLSKLTCFTYFQLILEEKQQTE